MPYPVSACKGTGTAIPYSYDVDAQTFITATSLSDDTQKNAINNLVISLKNNGLWTKMKAFYPFVGGTATTHKYNLKDPQDTDGAYRMVFSGTITHDSNGITPNGTSGFGNTKFALSSFSTSSGCIGFYCRTSGTTAGIDMGASGNGTYGAPIAGLDSRFSDNNTYAGITDAAWGVTTAVATAAGFICANRLDTDSNDNNTYVNGSSIGGSNAALTSVASGNTVYLGAFNLNGTTANYTARNYAAAFISDGLSSSEHSNLYTAVQTYQTSLGRNV